ncbi:MAG: hypothetical protein U5L76_00895 [Patescibacteria group bacterium]|nr:hypothetical protein [Patescibacteria group bacterium]
MRKINRKNGFTKALNLLTLGALVVYASFLGVFFMPQEVDSSASYNSLLVLENKYNEDSVNQWEFIDDDGIKGYLLYNSYGPEFEYRFEANGLNDQDYVLIYYADPYPGSPALMIDEGTASGGNLVLQGSNNTGDLPYDSDPNKYNLVPDNYVHRTGAKIWLIPASDYDADNEKTTINWHPHSETDLLFETDLIHYTKTTDLNKELILENKDSNWDIVPDTTQARLYYNDYAEKFNYKLKASGLEINQTYALIYYADQQERFDNWGGDNPGALITEVIANEKGNITETGHKDLGMNLPEDSDWNNSEDADYCNYHNGYDDYDHCNGAKIWLVPSDDYNETDNQLTSWNPDNYLFETDLITYTKATEDCPNLKELFEEAYQSEEGDDSGKYEAVLDFDDDGKISLSDFGVLGNNFDNSEWCGDILKELEPEKGLSDDSNLSPISEVSSTEELEKNNDVNDKIDSSHSVEIKPVIKEKLASKENTLTITGNPTNNLQEEEKTADQVVTSNDNSVTKNESTDKTVSQTDGEVQGATDNKIDNKVIETENELPQAGTNFLTWLVDLFSFGI